MSPKNEGVISIVAAVIVLLSAMLDPRISLGLAVVALVGLGIYQLTKKRESSAIVDISMSKQTEEKERNKTAIMNLMESGNQPLTNEHIRQMLGISDATATRYMDELQKEGKVKQVGKAGAHVFYEKI